MSIWNLVKLNFGRNLAHFGEVGIGLEQTSDRIRSDSLFSALISTYARLFGKEAVEELLQLFPINKQTAIIQPIFRISSTFIYREVGKDTIYYLPRPLKFPIKYPDDDLAFFKAYKKLNYLPLCIWERWYQGTGFTTDDAQELETYAPNKSKGQLATAGVFDCSKAYEIEQIPKIAVDRNTRATNIYHTSFVRYALEGTPAGLYFLLEFSLEGKKMANQLEATLRLLGEEGIGGERSNGAGKFTVDWLELPDKWQNIVGFSQGNYHTLLSLFWDSPISTGFLDQASYEIQERGGWIAESQLRRRMVRMFSEGSVFSTLPQGKLVDVTPNGFKKHSIYRSGISLSLPINIKEK